MSRGQPPLTFSALFRASAAHMMLYWHDTPIEGRREYCCDACFKKIKRDLETWWNKKGAS